VWEIYGVVFADLLPGVAPPGTQAPPPRENTGPES